MSSSRVAAASRWKAILKAATNRQPLERGLPRNVKPPPSEATDGGGRYNGATMRAAFILRVILRCMVARSKGKHTRMGESNGDSSQPHNEETERAILGAVMLDNSLATIVLSKLTADDFYSVVTRDAFAAMKALHKEDATAQINPISLIAGMRRAGSYVEGVASEISSFNYGLPSISVNTLTKQYIPALRQQTASRQTLRAIAGAEERLRRGDESPCEVIGAIIGQLETIRQRADFGASALRVARMADVAPETVTWLWFPFIPKGKLTILEGEGESENLGSPAALLPPSLMGAGFLQVNPLNLATSFFSLPKMALRTLYALA